MDLEGIGDADGDPRRYVDVGNFYTEAFGAAVGAILDDLEARGFGPRFVLVGLCAGAYWAFTTAASDRRVIAGLLVNPRAMVWDPGLLARRDARKVGRVLQPALWNRVVRGDVSASRVIAVSRAIAGRTIDASVQGVRRLVVRRRSDTTGEAIERRLDAVRNLGTRLLIAFSGDEPVYDELRSDGILARMDRWPNVRIETIPGRDHTVRPIVAQQAVHDMFARALARLHVDA
jgi:dienelactone hydrolase